VQPGGGAVDTSDNQQAVDGENQRARWPTYALYRLDLKEPGDKVAWIEKKNSAYLK
jgi:hypothetical protein